MNEELTFEMAMQRLERIVKTLEEGNAPLEESLAVFEEGIRLVKFCNSSLDAAEQKVKILLDKGNGDIAEEPFTVKA